MSRTSISAVLLATLLSSTALLSTTVMANDLPGDMPSDSLPFGLATHKHHRKSPSAATVPDSPAELGAVAATPSPHHGRQRPPSAAAIAAADKAFLADHPVVMAPEPVPFELAAGPSSPAEHPVTAPRSASQPDAPVAAVPLPAAPTGPSSVGPTAVPLAAPPGYGQQNAPGLPVPPPASARPLRASLSATAVVASALPLAGPVPRQPPQAEPTIFPAQAGPHPIPSAAAPAAPAAAPPQAAPTATRNTVEPVRNGLTLEAGLGRVIELAGNTASVFAADPKVVEVRPASASSLFVFGVAPGRTTIAALDSTGHPVAQYDVTVVPSAYASSAARGTISHALPGSGMRLDTTGNGLAVGGRVGSPGEAERAMQIARGYLPSGQIASNRIDVNANVQVNLRVRIAEMSRSVTRTLGVNWSAMADIGKYATFSGATANAISTLAQQAFAGGFTKKGGVDAVIDALATDQLVHTLAEPNLTAMSGETASFLVGGEFPIPVAQQNNQTTIEFKQYGVSLAFVPTVISDGHISLKVRPEVSQLSTQGAVTLTSGNSSFQVPALSVRRAETTVELGSGQSFAIAGLLQDGSTITDNAVPFLGEIPILGTLFRSDAFLRNQTELVIIVTPYIVRPASNPTALALSTDNQPLPDDSERLLYLRQVGRLPGDPRMMGDGGPTNVVPRANGGFVVQ